MTPGELWSAIAVLYGAAMFGLGWWGGHSGLIRRAYREIEDHFEDGPARLVEDLGGRLVDDRGPLIAPADLTLAAALPSPVPGLAYVPDPARIQAVPGFDGLGDYEDQYNATWAHAAERSRWAANIIEGIWKGIRNETDRNG